MRTNGHNAFKFRRVLAATLGLMLAGTGVAAAAEGSSEPAPLVSLQLDTLSSSNTFKVPTVAPIEVPQHVREAAARAGIEVPERIVVDPRTTAASRAEVDAQLEADSEAQLTREGHHKDARAEAIAAEWAQQAVDGTATFNGDVGRGTTHAEEGTGQIYRLDDAAAQQRLDFLNRENVETTPHPHPSGFGVAVARSEDGTTAYLAEYFLR